MKVLVVDDHEPMRKILKNILRSVGYHDIVEAQDGQDALNKLKTQKYDVILLDINMPGLSGYDVLKSMKDDQTMKDIPVIMVTGESSKEKILELLKLGISGYLVKPFTPDSLKRKLSEILQR